jgi:hypothetical protein
MISEGKRLLMRLAACVRLDRSNPFNLHVEIDSVIAHLAEHNLYVPNTEYTQLVQKMLEEQVAGKIPANCNEAELRRKIAKALLALASNMIGTAELTADMANKERIKFFGPDGKLLPIKGKTTL